MSKRGFFDGTSMPLRFGALGFLIAAIGVALIVVLGDSYRPGNILAAAAFWTVATGIGIGFAAIAWGWVALLVLPLAKKVSQALSKR